MRWIMVRVRIEMRLNQLGMKLPDVNLKCNVDCRHTEVE